MAKCDSISYINPECLDDFYTIMSDEQKPNENKNKKYPPQKKKNKQKNPPKQKQKREKKHPKETPHFNTATSLLFSFYRFRIQLLKRFKASIKNKGVSWL